jgi:nicotinate dehydrogenase subunit A
MAVISLVVNGARQTVDVDPATPLLYVLSDDLALAGPKFGCGLGQCGACTVLARGQAIRSCITPVSSLAGAEITTLEGLGTPEAPHPLQQVFLAEQAGECAYCVNGMLMVAAALLGQNASPSAADIKQALNGNLCRCGSQARFVRAVQRAAGVTA